MFKGLIIGVNEEENSEFKVSKASTFMGFPFVVESSPSNVEYRVDGAIILFPFKRGSETIDAGITVQAEGLRRIDNNVLMR